VLDYKISTGYLLRNLNCLLFVYLSFLKLNKFLRVSSQWPREAGMCDWGFVGVPALQMLLSTTVWSTFIFISSSFDRYTIIDPI
jgi:hypothetical protein